MQKRTKCIATLLIMGLFVLSLIGMMAPPAGAHACAEVRVWQDDSPTPVGDCLPVFDEWAHLCPWLDQKVDGDGAGFTVCVPRPV